MRFKQIFVRPLTAAALAVMLAWGASGALTRAQSTGPSSAATDRSGARATKDANAEQTAIDERQHSFWALVEASGWVGFTIIGLSVVGMALCVQYLLTFREKVLMPPGLAESVRELLRAGQAAQAIQQCKLQPSFLSQVLLAGLQEVDSKWSSVEKAMEDAAADQAARLYRKLEYLSMIANLAPMLGLLGTVLGMVYAFREVAMTGGAARAADLAEGIYLALVTTVEGLLVAIPALALYALFRNRLDQLIAEAAEAAVHVFAPLRRSQKSVPARSG